MVETDWKEVLSYSQIELGQADKEKLCESLSWMEADDIELNFTDLKTLFRLAQDILKYKSEQVNNLLGKLESRKKERKRKTDLAGTPSKSPDSAIDMVAHQEEIIKANKEVLDQLYADIAELEGRKSKLEESGYDDKESESSRDTLSQMEAIAQLENEVVLKNRHIRKLLGDIKIMEEEENKLKEKVYILKEKLNEATGLIENLTDQLFVVNNECSMLKDALGKSEESKANLVIEMKSLRQQLSDKDSKKDSVYEDLTSKVEHWKNIAEDRQAKIDALNAKYKKLKDEYAVTIVKNSSPIKKSETEEKTIFELHNKLSEAAIEILRSAKLIEQLKSENHQLKSKVDETQEYTFSDERNESDEGKERNLISKLKKKNKNLSVSLRAAEDMIALREEELAEITRHLNILQYDEGIRELLQNLKTKKRQLKFKDEGIKSLVIEVNKLNDLVSDLQLENEAMRQKLNIPESGKIPTKGIMKQFYELKLNCLQLNNVNKKLENNVVALEMDNRSKKEKIIRLEQHLKDIGYGEDKLLEIHISDGDMPIDGGGDMPTDGGGESSMFSAKKQHESRSTKLEEEMKALADENEGLRQGLEEILNFLKDNSATSSGALCLQCPSLDAVLNSMSARHAAGWFAPHMATALELKEAVGGKNALLAALHDARKETQVLISQIEKESNKSLELEQKLKTLEMQKPTEIHIENVDINLEDNKFGSWVSDNVTNNVDYNDKAQIEEIVSAGNLLHEENLKTAILYFHNKFKYLYNKMTSISIEAADKQSKWSIQEEKYKAEIEILQQQIASNIDDLSDSSPGVVCVIDNNVLERKCIYLEEQFKLFKTTNENLKNEILELKKEKMETELRYENRIQQLILTVANLTDRLRCSISLDLFWKQNISLCEINAKYRKCLVTNIKNEIDSADLANRLEDDKIEIMSKLQNIVIEKESVNNEKVKMLLMSTEQTVLQTQLNELCLLIDKKNEEITSLQSQNLGLQENQQKLINQTLHEKDQEHYALMKDNVDKLEEENRLLRKQWRQIQNNLDITSLELQDMQQKKLSNEVEINMLRHQILDLQSAGDNKAIIARLSNEVLVAHMQSLESYNKIEELSRELNMERQLRAEAEEMLSNRQKVFELYSSRFQSKFRYMFEVMQVFREQYQGSIPLISLEEYVNKLEDISRAKIEVEDKLSEIEDVRSNLMVKHCVFEQVLGLTRNNCTDEEENCCHKLQLLLLQASSSREKQSYVKQIEDLENARKALMNQFCDLERTFVLVSRAFVKEPNSHSSPRVDSKLDDTEIELEELQSDDESGSRMSKTFSIPEPKILKQPSKANAEINAMADFGLTLPGSPLRLDGQDTKKQINACVQTAEIKRKHIDQIIQTEQDKKTHELKEQINNLKKELEIKNKDLNEAFQTVQFKTEDIIQLNAEKAKLLNKIQSLKEDFNDNERNNQQLAKSLENLQKQLDDIKTDENEETNNFIDRINKENRDLLASLKLMEASKNQLIEEYKQILSGERDTYAKTIKELQMKLISLESQSFRKTSDADASADVIKETVLKYNLNIEELQDKCFELQNKLDCANREILSSQNELERWKSLASERLSKMEQMNSQLEDKHYHEVESYKAETEHWISQLNESQKELLELRTRAAEQKTMYIKQLGDKDAQIEQMRSVMHNLKTQIMSMQTVMSVSDPSFDLSAIVEMEEETVSPHSTEQLELKFGSANDLNEDGKPTVSTTLWQESIIDRLRRDKQLLGKQNGILRRQIKALAARERRARLDAQNLRNQVFRISTGNRMVSGESAALQHKIASLQSQLSSARRDTNTSVAMWDKWKRAQQSAERWQARYEEQCQESKRLESSLHLAKSAIERLEKEKRVLLSRLAEAKSDNDAHPTEKQDTERSEKTQRDALRSAVTSPAAGVGVSAQALLARVEAQQRRIAALECAEKGKEVLVSEYERALAEITALKGQVLKLESALLESQIRIPLGATDKETQPELQYWKSYCEMLKEENVQLTLKVTASEATPATHQQHRIYDLEQTVLTLRGLVSKMQAEQKFSSTIRRDYRPNSERSVFDKGHSKADPHRIELTNLKRSLQDKDLLLERSKEMLTVTAEREEDLLKENTFLRRQLEESTKTKGGFLSA